MAFGRAFPIRAHTAGSLALPPSPPLPAGRIVLTTKRRPFIGRQSPRPVILPPPIVGLKAGPRPKIVSQSIQRGQEAFADRLLPFRVHVPQAIVARGPPVPPAYVVGQARTRSTLVRGAPSYSVRWQPPAPAGPAPLVISLQANRRAFQGRGPHPYPHLAAPVVGPPPSFSGPLSLSTVISQAHLRPYQGRAVPRPHLAGPQLGTVPTTPAQAKVIGQSRDRALQRRTVPRPHLAAPLTPRPIAPNLVVSQARRRPYVGRTVPRPHLAPPVSTVGYVPPALVVSQARQRAYVGRSTPRPHLPGPPNNSPVDTKPFVISQAGQRALTGRGAPSYEVRYLASTVTPSGAFVVSQALRRAYLGRQVPRAHLAAPVIGAAAPTIPPVATLPTIVSQARSRALSGRGAPSYDVRYLAPAVPGPSAYVVSQALKRPYVGRLVPQALLASPRTATGGLAPAIEVLIVSTTIYHALEWPKSLRRPIPTHRAAPLVPAASPARVSPPPFVASPPFIGTLRRGVTPAHLARPVLSQAGPRATSTSQALRRALQGRSPRTLRLAPAVTAPRGPGATVVSQAVKRATIGRSVPLRPRLATPIVQPPQAPVAFGKVVSTAVRRAADARTWNRVLPAHVARPSVIAAGPGATVKSQAIQRSTERRYRDVAPAPHLAPPVTAHAFGRATLVYQSLQRAYVGRNGRVRTAPAPRALPVASGTFVYVLREAVGRRSVPRPHLAGPAFPPASRGTFVYSRVQPTGRRAVPAPHLAPHVKAQTGPGATIRLQAVARSQVVRGVPLEARVAAPLVGPPIFYPPVPYGLFVEQAVQRSYVDRKVPVSPSSRYHPRTYTPSNVVPPHPPITSRATTAPRSARGLSSPRPHNPS